MPPFVIRPFDRTGDKWPAPSYWNTSRTGRSDGSGPVNPAPPTPPTPPLAYFDADFVNETFAVLKTLENPPTFYNGTSGLSFTGSYAPSYVGEVSGIVTGIGTDAYTEYSIRGYNTSDVDYFVGSATPNRAELVFYGTNPDGTFDYSQTGTYDYGYTGSAAGRATAFPSDFTGTDLRVDIYAVSDIPYLISRSNLFTGAVLFSEPYPYSGSFGPIVGRVEGLDPGQYADYEIQVFSKTDQDYYQSTGTIQGDGTWAAAQAFTGTKIAKLIRKSDGGIFGHTYAPFVYGFVAETDSGIKRADLVANAYGTTVGQSGAVLGGFSIPFGTPGYKTLKLVKVPEENLIAEHYWGQGLLRSYGMDQSDPSWPYLYKRTYTYDQALSIVAAVGMEDWETAERWSRGLVAAWTPLDRQWAFSVNTVSAVPPDPYYRTGANFWCASALAWYLNKAPTVPPDLQSSIEHVLGEFAGTMVTEYWVDSDDKQVSTFRGGRGRYQLPVWEFNGTYQVPWVSTEHNTDAYWFAKEYYAMTGSQAWHDYGTRIGQVLNTTFWQGTYSPPRAYQGMTNNSSPDTAHALDVASWYSSVVRDVGAPHGTVVLDIIPDYQTRGIYSNGTFFGSFAPVGEFSGTYYGTQSGTFVGYTPYSPDYGYPGASGGLWIEGTAGVVHAWVGAGLRDEAVALHTQLRDLLGPNGFPYTLFNDASYDLRDWTSVAATGWMVIAARPAGWWGVDTLT